MLRLEWRIFSFLLVGKHERSCSPPYCNDPWLTFHAGSHRKGLSTLPSPWVTRDWGLYEPIPNGAAERGGSRATVDCYTRTSRISEQLIRKGGVGLLANHTGCAGVSHDRSFWASKVYIAGQIRVLLCHRAGGYGSLLSLMVCRSVLDNRAGLCRIRAFQTLVVHVDDVARGQL